MKIRIEFDKELAEPEVVIYCSRVDEVVREIRSTVNNLVSEKKKLSFTKDSKEYFLPAEDILFFESVDGSQYAHTEGDIYKAKYRLYELEGLLSKGFMRISKSTIVNKDKVLSINRGVGRPNIIQFVGSHKQVSVSRRYFKELRSALNERSSI